MSRERSGVLLCLLSAAAFSSAALFGRIALDAGAGVATILALRYGGAAVLFWLLVRLTMQRLPSRSAALRVLVFGALALSAQSALFYSALARLDAALVTLLLYAFPAMVAVGSVASGRERSDARKALAVVLVTVGVCLVLAGDVSLQGDGLGVSLALASALCYAVYLLGSDRLLRGVPALVVAALVSTGAAGTLWTSGLLLGAIGLSFAPLGWAAVVGTILLTTVLAISTSLAGVARVGPTVAGVLATFEVPLAVLWASLLLNERLQPLQLAGAALLVVAVPLLQLRGVRLPGRWRIGARATGPAQPVTASPREGESAAS